MNSTHNVTLLGAVALNQTHTADADATQLSS